MSGKKAEQTIGPSAETVYPFVATARQDCSYVQSHPSFTKTHAQLVLSDQRILSTDMGKGLL